MLKCDCFSAKLRPEWKASVLDFGTSGEKLATAVAHRCPKDECADEKLFFLLRLCWLKDSSEWDLHQWKSCKQASSYTEFLKVSIDLDTSGEKLPAAVAHKCPKDEYADSFFHATALSFQPSLIYTASIHKGQANWLTKAAIFSIDSKSFYCC